MSPSHLQCTQAVKRVKAELTEIERLTWNHLTQTAEPAKIIGYVNDLFDNASWAINRRINKRFGYTR